MADTWATDDRVKEITDYIAQGANEEDLLAAGFTNDELFQVGFFNPPAPSTYRRPEKDDVGAGAASLSPYQPTKRQEYTSDTQQMLTDYGLDKHTSRTVAEKVWGNPASTKGDLGLGLADVTPLGAVFAGQEGAREFTRGYNSGDKSDMAMGAVNAGLGVLEALPLGKPIAKGIKKAGDALADGFDPSQVNMFIGPKANLTQEQIMSLGKAQKLDAEGYTRMPRSLTGWSKDPKEDKWHLEISDKDMTVPFREVNEFVKANKVPDDVLMVPQRLFDLVDHPELERAYPFLDSYEIQYIPENHVSKAFPEGVLGTHNRYDRIISVRLSDDNEQGKKVLAHELQHAIDSHEWRDSGASGQKVWSDISGEFGNLTPREKDYLAAKEQFDTIKTMKVNNPDLAAQYVPPSVEEWWSQEITDLGSDLGAKRVKALDHFLEVADATHQNLLGEDEIHKIYENNLGETRARITMDRLGLSEAERRSGPDPLADVNKKGVWTNKEFNETLNLLREFRTGLRDPETGDVY